MRACWSENAVKKLCAMDAGGRKWIVVLVLPEPGTNGSVSVTLEDGRAVRRIWKEEFAVVNSDIRFWLEARVIRRAIAEHIKSMNQN